jgi:hypothetical protein
MMIRLVVHQLMALGLLTVTLRHARNATFHPRFLRSVAVLIWVMTSILPVSFVVFGPQYLFGGELYFDGRLPVTATPYMTLISAPRSLFECFHLVLLLLFSLTLWRSLDERLQDRFGPWLKLGIAVAVLVIVGTLASSMTAAWPGLTAFTYPGDLANSFLPLPTAFLATSLVIVLAGRGNLGIADSTFD